MKKQSLIYFAVFLLVLAFTFRSLIAGITTNLPDWYDTAFVAWIIRNNVDKFISLNFSGIFNTNILYPYQNTLLLTETFFTQSFLALPFRIFSQNPIFLFNMSYLLTFILNYLSAFIFWKKIFKKPNVAFLGALLVVFSPFFHAELGHFQMQSYWPSFFSLYFLFKSEEAKTFKNSIIGGLFLAVQFLASAYLAIFLIVIIALYFVSQAILHRKFSQYFKQVVLVYATFVIVCAPVIIGYLTAQKQFHVQIDYGQYVFYSAHLSDYLFSQGINSVIHQLTLISKWNAFNHHNIGEIALFPGFVLSGLAILGYFTTKLKKEGRLFFLLVTVTGFLFSLGPRINFNGSYSGIPLPYHFLLKYIPFFNVIRAPGRWMLVFYIGLIFFALKYLSKITLKLPIFLLLTTLILLEYFPINIQAHAEAYIQPKDRILKELCAKEKKVVLEVPVTHFDAGANIYEGLTYLTKTILASTYHRCYLVNGYSSYDLPSIATLKNSLYDAGAARDIDKFASLLASSQAGILVVNENFLRPEVKADFLVMIEKLEAKKYLLPHGDGVFEIRIPNQQK